MTYMGHLILKQNVRHLRKKWEKVNQISFNITIKHLHIVVIKDLHDYLDI